MRTLIVAVTLGLAVWIGRPAAAQEAEVTDCGVPNCQATTVLGSLHHCARCGCRQKCQRYVCHVVCGTKKVTKICWDVKCEPHCPLLPGCGAFLPKKKGACGSCAPAPCTPDCGQCDQPECGSCGCSHRSEVPPRCGHVRTRKRLMKKVITVEVPVYRCEVKYLCNECCQEEPVEAAPSEQAERTEPAPLPPVTSAEVPTLPAMLGDDV